MHRGVQGASKEVYLNPGIFIISCALTPPYAYTMQRVLNLGVEPKIKAKVSVYFLMALPCFANFFKFKW